MSLNSKLFPKYPKSIQIQTVTGCNASCMTCPTGLSSERTKHNQLPMELWEKIVQECSHWEVPLRAMVLSLFNEPLIDKRLFDMIDMAKERLPNTSFSIVTNGSLLTEQTVERIIQSRLDEIRVSVNAHYKESYEQLKNSLDFDRVVEGTKRILEKSKKAGKPIVIVSMLEVQFNTEEVEQFIDFWSQLGAQVHISPAWNRAGNIPSGNKFQLEPAGRTGKLCSKPFVTFCITYDGTAVFCCADYEAEIILGNVQEQKLLDVWMGPTHQAAILKMLKSQNPLCNRCDKLVSFRTQKGEVLVTEPT